MGKFNKKMLKDNIHYKKNSLLIIILVILLLSLNFLEITTIADDKARPDLIINYVNFPGTVTEGNTIEFVVKIKNIVNGQTGEYGDIPSGTIINVALFIDYNVVSTNSTSEGLNVNQSKYVNLSWTAELGSTTQRKVSIAVDYTSTITESNENNNVWDGYININEKEALLEIISISIPGKLIVNKATEIIAEIKNNGKETTNPIYAKLNSSEDGQIQTLINYSSLSKDETCFFSFNWIPSHFGSQKISIDIIYNNKTHDFEEKSVIVEVEELKWWNENWHYRYFFSVNGSGNISVFFNFTKLLNDLGVYSQVFENNTIRVIEYRKNGSFIGEIIYYQFNESIDFDALNNATGYLIWNTTGNSFEKYYCIYFDVSINLGSRTVSNETENMIESGNASIGLFSFEDGWKIELLQPMNNSYSLVNESINITVSTTAYSENISAYIFLTTNEGHNFTINLTNIGNYTFWFYENFTFYEEGNWIIRIFGNDWAGYNPEVVEYAFYVGKPDIEIKNISFITDWPPTSPKIYRSDTVSIIASIVSIYSNINNVNVSLFIYNLNNLLIYSSFTETIIFKDEINNISFSWKVDVSGDFNVKIVIDPENLINEENESNNELIKKITVYEWPDLEITDITIPYQEITELDVVRIEISIANKGFGNATNYEVELYIEQNIMSYSNKVNSTVFSVNINESKIVNIYWDSAKPGTWLVGAIVVINDTKRDTNLLNNRFLYDGFLLVSSIERIPPSISDVIISPTNQIQGSSVAITARIFDITGIESVTIKIRNPLNFSYDGNMVRINLDEFRFIFDDTLEPGFYKFTITAIDITYYKNTAFYNGSFAIIKDSESPVILYFDAQPTVQKNNDFVTITCIASDNLEIDVVTVTIEPPDNSSYTEEMELSSDGKYEYRNSYDVFGKYIYYIEVMDIAENIAVSDNGVFWITSNVKDTDNDGLPDTWEKEYNLDSQDPNDAGIDLDDDSYTNLKEYEMGTNPLKDIFVENVAFRIKDNILYFAGLFILFFFLIVFYFIGKRRELK